MTIERSKEGINSECFITGMRAEFYLAELSKLNRLPRWNPSRESSAKQRPTPTELASSFGTIGPCSEIHVCVTVFQIRPIFYERFHILFRLDSEVVCTVLRVRQH